MTDHIFNLKTGEELQFKGERTLLPLSLSLSSLRRLPTRDRWFRFQQDPSPSLITSRTNSRYATRQD